jgi:hypothetical protein
MLMITFQRLRRCKRQCGVSGGSSCGCWVGEWGSTSAGESVCSRAIGMQKGLALVCWPRKQVRWSRSGLWPCSASEIVCDCGWSQDGVARKRSQCGPRWVGRGCEMCNFVQTGRGCVVLSRLSKLSLCRKELEAGGGQVRAALPIGHPRRWHFPLHM